MALSVYLAVGVGFYSLLIAPCVLRYRRRLSEEKKTASSFISAQQFSYVATSCRSSIVDRLSLRTYNKCFFLLAGWRGASLVFYSTLH